MAKPPIPTVIAIVGPTSTGKTDLSVRIAKKINGEIISGDSRQVYQGLDIGTGKVTPREMRGVPHHLVDIVSPRTVYNASAYVRDGRRALRDILQLGKTPIIVGGTGFYIDALLGRIELASIEPNQTLRNKLKRLSLRELQTRLKRVDPKRYRGIDIKNPRRLIRAIEISVGTPTALPLPLSHIRIIWIGLTLPTDVLKKKIHFRLIERIRKGMLGEAKQLHRRGVSWKRMHALGLEYRYLALYLQKKISKKEMMEQLEKEIVAYAKRQMTWFKKNPKICWFSPQEARQILDSVGGQSLFLRTPRLRMATRARQSRRGKGRSQ
ncbi:MAG: tRNA (adenosine(37)-N6)-dimethylallyltransferase MiaA [Patescibacteria group bacterium]